MPSPGGCRQREDDPGGGGRGGGGGSGGGTAAAAAPPGAARAVVCTLLGGHGRAAATAATAGVPAPPGAAAGAAGLAILLAPSVVESAAAATHPTRRAPLPMTGVAVAPPLSLSPPQPPPLSPLPPPAVPAAAEALGHAPRGGLGGLPSGLFRPSAPAGGGVAPSVAGTGVAAAVAAGGVAGGPPPGDPAPLSAASAATSLHDGEASAAPTLSMGQHMVAGALAGMTEHLAMFPMDTVKTRMQSYAHAGDGRVSLWRTTTDLARARLLYRGVGAVALSAGPAHALYFGVLEAAKGGLAPLEDALYASSSPSAAFVGSVSEAVVGGGGGGGGVGDVSYHPLSSAMAGAVATVASDAIMTPLDVVKQRMQLSVTDGSVAACVARVHAEHGFGAFFAGFRTTLLMNVPFFAVHNTVYDAASAVLRGVDFAHGSRTADGRFSAACSAVAGGVAGAAAAAVTTPLDVVKTRLQTQGEVGARRYGGMRDALLAVAREEGARGLARGMVPRVLFHAPAAAVCWTTYEGCKYLMGVTGEVGGG